MAAKAEAQHARVNLENVLPAKLAEAKANRVRDETDFANKEAMLQRQAASEVEVVEARANRDATRARVDQVKAEILLDLLDDELFRQRFDNKGRFTKICSEIPLAIVLAEHPGLRGCVEALRKGV